MHAKAKVGDLIKILGFKPDSDGKIYISEAKLIGKTGRVTSIGDRGELHGTWGGISVLPVDEIEVIEEPETIEDTTKLEE